mmetsp:Transcript_647/g.1023  ORF Transcript_647/g.1023 Transcript_647/m.1023 type:complete len:410 (+) Transcript_647:98-1327(+)
MPPSPSPTHSVKEEYLEEFEMGQSCQKSDAITIVSKGESTNCCPSPTNSTTSTTSVQNENYKDSASTTPDTTFDSSAVVSLNAESIQQEQEQDSSVDGSTTVTVADFEKENDKTTDEAEGDDNAIKAENCSGIKSPKVNKADIKGDGEEEQTDKREEALDKVAELTAKTEPANDNNNNNDQLELVDAREVQVQAAAHDEQGPPTLKRTAHNDNDDEITINVPPPPPDLPPTPCSKASSRSRRTGLKSAMTQQQQLLMVESGKLLEHLRKEVYKLRSQNSQLKADFRSLQENNQRLMDANNSLGTIFNNLNKQAKQVSKTNAKLASEVQKTRKMLALEREQHSAQIESLQMQQIELKDELTMKQETYITEVHSRLHYQKVMMGIVDLVQERCRDHRLVEGVLAMSDECEL